jgi:phosphoglycerate dehydrogenase-like enzyme
MKMLLLMAFDDSVTERIRAIAPDAEVQTLSRRDDAYPSALREAEVVVGSIPPDHAADAPNLRWLQASSAGVYRLAEQLPPAVTLTNARGVYGTPIAEHLVAMLLTLTRGIQAMIVGKQQRQWQRPKQLTEIAGRTCGILGTGDIGAAAAKRLRAMEMTVIGVNRTGGPCLEGFDELFSVEALDDILPRCEVLISTLPGTPHTRGLLHAARLARLPRGALVLNVGRGSTIDEPALVEALRSGRLGGAALDVFQTEPLPDDSPLWGLPNVLISPHCAGDTPRQAERLAEIFLDNLRRYRAGQPLQNVVDRRWGY